MYSYAGSGMIPGPGPDMMGNGFGGQFGVSANRGFVVTYNAVLDDAGMVTVTPPSASSYMQPFNIKSSPTHAAPTSTLDSHFNSSGFSTTIDGISGPEMFMCTGITIENPPDFLLDEG
jgi:hypothetical protein